MAIGPAAPAAHRPTAAHFEAPADLHNDPRAKARRLPDRTGTAVPAREVSRDMPAMVRDGMPTTARPLVDRVPTPRVRLVFVPVALARVVRGNGVPDRAGSAMLVPGTVVQDTIIRGTVDPSMVVRVAADRSMAVHVAVAPSTAAQVTADRSMAAQVEVDQSMVALVAVAPSTAAPVMAAPVTGVAAPG